MVSLEGIKERFQNGEFKKEIFIVLLLFLLAFGIRANLMHFEFFFGFDSYYHARIVGEIIQGTFQWNETQAYWQMPSIVQTNDTVAFWLVSATIYNIFTLWSGYDKELWIEFIKVLPALFGALTVVAMYFFTKAVYSRKAAIAAATIAAVVPSYVYRTLAGFFEDDSLGFLWLIIGFGFLAKAVKEPSLERKNLIYSLLAGLFFGIMAWTWGFFRIVPVLLVLYSLLAVLLFYLTKKEYIKPFLANIGLTLATFTLLASLRDGGKWFTKVTYDITVVFGVQQGFDAWPLLIFAVVVFGFFFFLLKFSSDDQKIKKVSPNALIVSIILFIAVMGLAFSIIDPTGFFNDRFFAEPGVLGATIGEEQKGATTFFYKYNALMVLPLIALLLIPLKILQRREKEHLSILMFFWIAISLFLAFYKLKYTYLFGLPIAISSGFIIYVFYDFFKKNIKLEAKLIAIVLSIILLTGIAAGSMFVEKRAPHIDTSQQYWKEALFWMKDNTPKDSKIFNWWSQGHWITFIGERTAFIDNRNADVIGDQDYAIFLTSSSLKESLEIMQKYEPDYVIIERNSLAAGTSFLVYAYWTTDLGSNPEAAKKSQSFFAVANGCDRTSPDVVRCSNLNPVSTEQYLRLPTQWTPLASDVVDESVPVWYYRNDQGNAIFILGKAMNESTLGKIWFSDPQTMQYFDQAFSNEALKIFKVNPALYSLDLETIDFGPRKVSINAPPVLIVEPEVIEPVEEEISETSIEANENSDSLETFVAEAP